MSETVTMTLTDFLLARIVEDEGRVAGLWQGDDPDFYWGPDRIRAECEAKRRIVADLGGFFGLAEFPAGLIEHTLRLLALPYADHADYREEWRP